MTAARTKQQTVVDLVDAMPPADIDAEKALLGSLLLDLDLIDELATILKPEDFYLTSHQVLYRTMRELVADGKRVDAVLILNRLKKCKADLAAVGGSEGAAEGAAAAASYLVELGGFVPHSAHARHYCGIVRSKATLRRLKRLGERLLQEAANEAADPQQLLARAEAACFAILGNEQRESVVSVRDVLLDLTALLSSGAKTAGLETGYSDLTSVLGGMRKGELLILAARPSIGKTALALNIACRVAAAGTSVYFASLEMNRQEMGMRLWSSASRVSNHRMRDGFLSPADRQALVKASGETAQLPLWIDDAPMIRVSDVAAACRRLRRKDGLGLIVVDYLQLLTPDDRKATNRQEQVAGVTRQLKSLAREMACPVLCLAQLNRHGETVEGERPKLSHLRESGAIENDADVVMFLYREGAGKKREAGEPPPDDRTAEVIVAKNRNGAPGTIKLAWFPETLRFEPLAARANEEAF